MMIKSADLKEWNSYFKTNKKEGTTIMVLINRRIIYNEFYFDSVIAEI